MLAQTPITNNKQLYIAGIID
uniref:Uncharacterized protein n=1 Tax=Arundo donax TaxID=35708 RepID=A0A0A9A7Y9_ARUDO